MNPARKLVVFDFDHTLYDGDSFTHLIRWRFGQHWWRKLLALLIAPLFAPLIAFLPTRRTGISGFVWVGTLGLRGSAAFTKMVEAYVHENREKIRQNLLPVALEVLHRHREAGDEVIVATGAPPELARAILAFVAHEDIPVLGSQVGPRLGAMVAVRHCHYRMKMRMIHEAGFTAPIWRAYSDSPADLPLLAAAVEPVVVNPKASAVAFFRQKLPGTTPILNWGCPGRAGEPVVAADAAARQ